MAPDTLELHPASGDFGGDPIRGAVLFRPVEPVVGNKCPGVQVGLGLLLELCIGSLCMISRHCDVH